MTSIEDKTLPPDWPLFPIREVTVRTSQRDPRKQPDNAFRYIDVSSVDNTLFKVRGAASLKGLEAPSRARKDIRTNDVLFATVRPTLKRIALIPPELDGEIASTGYCVLRPNRDKVEPAFLYCCVLTDWFIGAMGKLERGASYPAIRDSDVFAANIPVPSLAEQRKIAGVLELVQRAMEQQERLIALTTELKKALLHQLFTQGLRGEPQKQTEIGPVPQSWEVMPLGSLAKVGNGSTPKRDNEGYWQGGMIPWLNSAKIHERFITEADQFVTDLAVKECHLPRVKSGSLLVAITGQGKTLGNTALVSIETCINQHLAYAQFTTPRVVPEFVLWFMQTRYDHLRSISQAGGSTKGALTCGYLKTYPVPVPALDEQHEIAAVFAALDRKEKVHQRKHAALTGLFRTLLHQLMTAQIRVDKLDIEELM
jgi:type I restriction enzyme S subunit